MRMNLSDHALNGHPERKAKIRELGIGHEVGRGPGRDGTVMIATSKGIIVIIDPSKSNETEIFVVTMYIARMRQFERIATPDAETRELIRRNERAHYYLL